MKLSVSSYSFLKYMEAEKADYFDICDIAKRIGFDGIGSSADFTIDTFNAVIAANPKPRLMRKIRVGQDFAHSVTKRTGSTFHFGGLKLLCNFFGPIPNSV